MCKYSTKLHLRYGKHPASSGPEAKMGAKSARSTFSSQHENSSSNCDATKHNLSTRSKRRSRIRSRSRTRSLRAHTRASPRSRGTGCGALARRIICGSGLSFARRRRDLGRVVAGCEADLCDASVLYRGPVRLASCCCGSVEQRCVGECLFVSSHIFDAAVRPLFVDDHGAGAAFCAVEGV